jgi:5-methylcytosine-specific restriction endonuclease McrA
MTEDLSESDTMTVPIVRTMSNLEVHHKQFRSQAGHDSEENLITLCTLCHAAAHGWGDYR